MTGVHTTMSLVGMLLALTCNGGGRTTEPPPRDNEGVGQEIVLERVAQGLSFPLHLTSPRGDPRLFVVEKGGRVKIVKEGRVLASPFLDLSAEVSGGGEQGLLSLAFHPDYASNGRLFVDYTDRQGDTRVVEYRVSADPDRADPAPVRTVVTVDQPFSNHNGGLIVFGPDGMLYMGLGDGGSGGDPRGHGQNLATLLGSILRLDVDSGVPYAVPADNPFVGRDGARGEIWAHGLRNPWRFAFDRETGDLFVADVGQNRFEEVNAVRGAGRGLNYGWNVMEGQACFPGGDACERSGLTLPVVVYGHGEGCSVIGGHVYRGAAIPALRGLYFYSDSCSGFVRSFRFDGMAAVDHRHWLEIEPPAGDRQVTSFGEDAAGELYLMTAGGNLYKIVPR